MRGDTYHPQALAVVHGVCGVSRKCVCAHECVLSAHQPEGSCGPWVSRRLEAQETQLKG